MLLFDPFDAGDGFSGTFEAEIAPCISPELEAIVLLATFLPIDPRGRVFLGGGSASVESSRSWLGGGHGSHGGGCPAHGFLGGPSSDCP